MRIVRNNGNWLVLGTCGRMRLDLHGIAFRNGFRVSGMSATLGCSDRYLYDVFVRDVGLPPKAWLAQIRMVEARLRLRAGEGPGHVAGELGFSTLGSFRREFIRCYGVSPVRYLEKMSERWRERLPGLN
ncbi:helix-turn-helix transcriptional regulator [Luteolibacter ambystomatis]|uniref:Helix-turn-helix transcriptional regulator n=1 Tax=Luteolibacter ambystomatis TaxID=2824561 RepID=A0A975J377_9BACT|nr:AraC family transcriptional regulator [Luteolibacter ambystomatis]QUE53161.1 helix-turn-helix transcriptional regulator [Luteolibacter ambystomatis]